MNGYRRVRAARTVAALGGALCVLGALAVGADAATAPTAATGGASAITYSTATLSASVNAQGAATSYYFDYGTSTSYGSHTSKLDVGNGTIAVTVSQGITGLQAGVKYHYRVVASSSSGTTYANDRTFTTASIPLSVELAGSPDPVIFGSPFVVEGKLQGTFGPNREIVLQANPYPYTQGFQTVGNPEVTSSTGSFSFPYVGLLASAQLRVETASGTPSVISAVLQENVALRVSLHIKRAARRGYFKVYGTVNPAEVGGLVGFEELRPGNRYVNVNGTVLRTGSSSTSVFSRTVRLKAHRLYRALVEPVEGSHVAIESASVVAP